MRHLAGRLVGRAHREGRSLLRQLRPRRAHLYGVGTAKSGTHSVAALFGRRLVAAHEAEAEALIARLLADPVDADELRRYLVARDRRLRLEVDASQLNGLVLDPLLERFPHARFLLTIRHPYDWLDSFLNHELAHPSQPEWQAFRDWRFATGRPHPPEESALAARGRSTLDGYLGYWARHNRTVLERVPADRLLVVRTDELGRRLPELAAFAGVPESWLDPAGAHAFPAATRFGVLDEVDPTYLADRIRHHGGDLVARFFPDCELVPGPAARPPAPAGLTPGR